MFFKKLSNVGLYILILMFQSQIWPSVATSASIFAILT